MSPQSGLPHNNRVGDFDVFALPVLLRETGKSLEEILAILAGESGLEGMSGAGRDLRDIEAAATAGDDRSQLAIDQFIGSIRHYLGAYLRRAGRRRRDRLHRRDRRELVADPLRASAATSAGSASSSTRRSTNPGPVERKVSTAGSRVQVWTVPTNEEIVVARQSKDILEGTAETRANEKDS